MDTGKLRDKEGGGHPNNTTGPGCGKFPSVEDGFCAVLEEGRREGEGGGREGEGGGWNGRRELGGAGGGSVWRWRDSAL